MTLSEAIRMVELGQAQRIATPGQWKVWREGAAIKREIIGASSSKQ